MPTSHLALDGLQVVRKPDRLKAGDVVRLVSPASPATAEGIEACRKLLGGLGLVVDVGEHALDRLGYLAGRDEDRAEDFNEALRDPTVRAIIATGGGKGAYRIADRLDFDAAKRDPKPLVGFSELTILHLALWGRARVPGIHGAPWPETFGRETAASFRTSVMSREAVVVRANPQESTAALTTRGKARGVLLGGNIDMIGTAAGWILPDLRGSLLLIEGFGNGLGHLDRILTRLMKSGALDGVAGVAVGQFTAINPSGGWTEVDVLRDRLGELGVPVLGGLPLGHGENPIAVPLGTEAVLDADAGSLTVQAAVN